MSQSPEPSNFVQEVFSASSGVTIRKRGQWNNTRRLSAIDAMLLYRPFEQKQTKKGPAWEKVFKAVNDACPQLKRLGRSAIREQINKLVNEAKVNRKSPSHIFETLLERRTLQLALSMEEEAVLGAKGRIGKRRQKLIQERNDILERCNIDTSTSMQSADFIQNPVNEDNRRSSAETEHRSEHYSILERDFRSSLIAFGDMRDKQAKQIQQFDQVISHISKSDDHLKQISLQLQMMAQQQHLFFSYMSRKIEEMTTKPPTPPYILPNTYIPNKPN